MRSKEDINDGLKDELDRVRPEWFLDVYLKCLLEVALDIREELGEQRRAAEIVNLSLDNIAKLLLQQLEAGK